MARKITIKRPSASTFKGWAFVLVAGVVLAALALVDRGDLADLAGGLRADGSTGCQVRVSVDELNVRAQPTTESALVEVLRRGATLDATRVVTAGFRQLEDGRWAADQFLTPLEGSRCG